MQVATPSHGTDPHRGRHPRDKDKSPLPAREPGVGPVREVLDPKAYQRVMGGPLVPLARLGEALEMGRPPEHHHLLHAAGETWDMRAHAPCRSSARCRLPLLSADRNLPLASSVDLGMTGLPRVRSCGTAPQVAQSYQLCNMFSRDQSEDGSSLLSVSGEGRHRSCYHKST